MGKKAVVAGHICIDITPAIPKQESSRIQNILVPGTTINVGGADIHPGGVVSNTGLAMKILGADVTLAGKIGDDAFGNMISVTTDRYDASAGLIRSAGDSTSYSVVLAIPGVDRIFLHHPGANDTFCVEDLPMEAIREAALFHFGYPPYMKKIYENDGAQLVEIMRIAQTAGAATSLDFAALDPGTESGKADWKRILCKTLPYVDIFVPSVEELMYMLERDKYQKLRDESRERDFTEMIDVKQDIIPLGRKCLEMGARIVLIKCGAPGMYYCTAGEECIRQISPRLEMNPRKWADRSGFERSFKADRLVSGTGAGDTSAAAFLTSILNGKGPEECVRYAAATGACCVAAYDALSGLISFEEMDQRFEKGWEKV